MVYSTAHNLNDIEIASKLNAEGLGQCRTDFMFHDPECIRLVQAIILAESNMKRTELLNQLIPLHEKMILHIFKLFPNNNISFRLLESALINFLPILNNTKFSNATNFKNKIIEHELNQADNNNNHSEKINNVNNLNNNQTNNCNISCESMADEAVINECNQLAKMLDISMEDVYVRIRSCKETIPFLGFRGARLGVVYPEIVLMQTKAIIGAAITHIQEYNSNNSNNLTNTNKTLSNY